MHRAHRRAVRLVVPLLVLGGLAACTPGSPASSSPTPSSSTTRPSADATTTGPTSAPTTAPTGDAPPASPEPTSAAPAPDDLTQVSVTIAYAGWVADAARVEVGAYVDGVIEGTGTCTLTLTRSGREVTTTVPAVADASSTSCGAVTVDGAQLSSGTWSAVVDYGSPTSVGSSAPTEVVVP